MRSRAHAHQEALARRLEQLREELAGTPERGPTPYDEGWDDYTRIRPRPPADAERLAPVVEAVEAVETAPEAAPPVPVPGRHAARRRHGWFDLSGLRGRVSLEPAHVTVAAVLAAVALGVTCWWVLADDAGEPLPTAQEAPTGLVTPGATTVPSGSASAAGADPSGELVVDVAGKVRKPGIVVLEPGSRVVDAVDAAGGAKRGADLTGLNLARVLADGEQIVVGEPPAPGLAASAEPSDAPGGSGSGADPGGLVNINTAGLSELDELPGVGPVTAQAIIDWRDANGGFRAVDQLLDVQGIGEKTLADLAPLVTL